VPESKQNQTEVCQISGHGNGQCNYLALAIEAVSFCGAKDTSGERGASMVSKNHWSV